MAQMWKRVGDEIADRYLELATQSLAGQRTARLLLRFVQNPGHDAVAYRLAYGLAHVRV